MKTLTPSQTAEILTGAGCTKPTLQLPDQPFTAILSDSRKIIPGTLFVALKGELHDGHEYIESALKSGAQGVVLQSGTSYRHWENESRSFFPVPDTLAAYRALAGAWRDRFKLPFVIVIGSVGKTTTKEFVSAVLSGHFPSLLKTQSSQNGFIGIPMTLLELRQHHQIAVIEVGIDEIGAMEKHLALIRPSSALLTLIGEEHLEKLGSLETVAREESLGLLRMISEGGVTITNFDDPWQKKLGTVMEYNKNIPVTLTQELRPPLDLRPSRFLLGKISGKSLEVLDYPDGPRFLVELPLPGEHNARNLLQAIALARSFGMNPNEISQGLKKFKAAAGRSLLESLAGGTIRVLCDYYNSQPKSLEAGLKTLRGLSHPETSLWACLGDMLELGAQEERLHREVAQVILREQIQHVLLYGPRMKWLEDELRKLSFSGHVLHFNSHEELAAQLKNSLKSGDAVLIKGSHSMKMELVWENLKNFFEPHDG